MLLPAQPHPGSIPGRDGAFGPLCALVSRQKAPEHPLQRALREEEEEEEEEGSGPAGCCPQGQLGSPALLRRGSCSPLGSGERWPGPSWVPRVQGGARRDCSLLLRDFLRQNLPSEVSLEELLQAGCEPRQLLRVKVLLGGRKRGMSAGSPRMLGVIFLPHCRAWSCSARRNSPPAKPFPVLPAGRSGSRNAKGLLESKGSRGWSPPNGDGVFPTQGTWRRLQRLPKALGMKAEAAPSLEGCSSARLSFRVPSSPSPHPCCCFSRATSLGLGSYLQDLIHDFLHDLTLSFRVAGAQNQEEIQVT